MLHFLSSFTQQYSTGEHSVTESTAKVINTVVQILTTPPTVYYRPNILNLLSQYIPTLHIIICLLPNFDAFASFHPPYSNTAQVNTMQQGIA